EKTVSRLVKTHYIKYKGFFLEQQGGINAILKHVRKLFYENSSENCNTHPLLLSFPAARTFSARFEKSKYIP
ncbi:hypothetical protein, partial [Neisseria gonorrhoeae]|uniref:hypothetical protein n=1 Tax=Neisseria gonorrhoeae TaxID=485 RepID=UPI001BC9837F